MALTKVMGQNFRAFVSGSAVSEESSCQVTIQGNMEDASTKDSVGSWNEEQMTSKQWSVQVDDVDSSLASLRALITAFNSDSKVTVGWDQTAGDQNRVAQPVLQKPPSRGEDLCRRRARRRYGRSLRHAKPL